MDDGRNALRAAGKFDSFFHSPSSQLSLHFALSFLRSSLQIPASITAVCCPLVPNSNVLVEMHHATRLRSP